MAELIIQGKTEEDVHRECSTPRYKENQWASTAVFFSWASEIGKADRPQLFAVDA